LKPLIHAKLSVKKHGGKVEDYLDIHSFIDSSKCAHPDVRHRAVLHSAFGCFLTERVFGVYIVNSDGKEVSVRDLAEEHIVQDLGFLPTLEHYLNNMAIQPWMEGAFKKNTKHEVEN
jgi:hypothetical protein